MRQKDEGVKTVVSTDVKECIGTTRRSEYTLVILFNLDIVTGDAEGAFPIKPRASTAQRDLNWLAGELHSPDAAREAIGLVAKARPKEAMKFSLILQ
jgi:hypothetical protein